MDEIVLQNVVYTKTCIGSIGRYELLHIMDEIVLQNVVYTKTWFKSHWYFPG